MTLQKLGPDFSVCKLPGPGGVDPANPFTFLAVTDEETSLVCETRHIPASAIAAEHGWRALRVAGVLDFGMVGVVSQISGILAKAGISLFVVSTYNTDYILLKSGQMEEACRLLAANGYEISE